MFVRTGRLGTSVCHPCGRLRGSASNPTTIKEPLPRHPSSSSGRQHVRNSEAPSFICRQQAVSPPCTFPNQGSYLGMYITLATCEPPKTLDPVDSFSHGRSRTCRCPRRVYADITALLKRVPSPANWLVGLGQARKVLVQIHTFYLGRYSDQ